MLDNGYLTAKITPSFVRILSIYEIIREQRYYLSIITYLFMLIHVCMIVTACS